MILALLLAACSDDPVSNDDVDPINREDGTILVPAEAATIQAAVDLASSGDTIMLAPGTYSGDGNRDISLRGKAILVTSSGGPAVTVIDCDGRAEAPHSAFILNESEDASTVIDGITIRDGYSNSGGAILCRSTTPTIRNCIFSDNVGTVSGGAIRLKDSSPTISNCTFVDNDSPAGAAVFCLANSSPRLERCVVAYSRSGAAIFATDNGSNPDVSCCLLYGNEAGNWNDLAEQPHGVGNLLVDPRFCDYEGGDYSISRSSPCLPHSNECGELIGALDAGCD